MSGAGARDGSEKMGLLHPDGSLCGSAVVNDQGSVRCTEHGQHIWTGLGGEYGALLERRMTYAGPPAVIKCGRPGCPAVIRGNNEPETTMAAARAGWSLGWQNNRCPRHRRRSHLYLVPALPVSPPVQGTGEER
jgi:hypothetical protein